MKRIIAVILLATALLGCSSPVSDDAPVVTVAADKQPTTEQIEAVNSELAAWAEGRWTEYSAAWSPEVGKLLLSVTAGGVTDEAVIKGYCRILDDIANQYLPDVAVSAAVYFPSGAKIECK